MGRDEEVENYLRMSDFGDSDKIVRSILLRAKGRNEEALGLIQEFLRNKTRLEF